MEYGHRSESSWVCFQRDGMKIQCGQKLSGNAHQSDPQLRDCQLWMSVKNAHRNCQSGLDL